MDCYYCEGSGHVWANDDRLSHQGHVSLGKRVPCPHCGGCGEASDSPEDEKTKADSWHAVLTSIGLIR